MALDKEIARICFRPQRTNWDHRNLMFREYSEMRGAGEEKSLREPYSFFMYVIKSFKKIDIHFFLIS